MILSGNFIQEMFLGSYIVIAVLVIFFCFLIVCYVLAVTFHHVHPVWPYVSYLGNRPYESCIFSLACSLSAAFIMLIVILRGAQLSDVIEKSERDEWYLRKMTKINRLSRVLGYLGASGFSVVASFQQKIFTSVHFIGVFFCVYISFFYFVSQTWLTFKLVPEITKRSVKITRLIAVIASGLILVVSLAVGIYHLVQYTPKPRLTDSVQFQDSVYIESAALEWGLLLFYLIFIASFYPDLKNISLTSDEIIIL